MSKRVFICVGHGGSDSGAVGYVVEKEAVLTISLETKRVLEKHGVSVGISRTRDEEDGLSKEVRLANDFGADLAIAVHANAGGGDGFEAYIQTNRFADQSRAIAQYIESRVESIGQNSRGIKTKQGSYGDYYYWLRNIDCPTVLLEGFFVDSSDAFDFDTEQELKLLGKMYAYGVLDYLGIQIDTLPFMDVSTGSYYHDAVKWALKNGITSGTSKDTFSPDKECTRAEAVTMLWAKFGKPEPENDVQFADVKSADYFVKAAQWALEKGITAGVGEGMFAPDTRCTRGQIVTMLWRSAGSPSVGGDLPFDDVKESDYFAEAVKWASAEGITAGVGGGKFAPHDPCNRAQMVMFLYKMNKE